MPEGLVKSQNWRESSSSVPKQTARTISRISNTIEKRTSRKARFLEKVSSLAVERETTATICPPNLGTGFFLNNEDSACRGTTRPGLIVVDASFRLLGYNDEAIQLLMFPLSPDRLQRRHTILSEKVRMFFDGHRGNGSAMHELRSGARAYFYHSFALNIEAENALISPAHVLVFERKRNKASTMSEACHRFGLTEREKETIQLLVQGLTSKEIADRMGISPNTVKCFLRLVMVKLGVSTRSGILGKVLSQNDSYDDGWSGGCSPRLILPGRTGKHPDRRRAL